MNKFFYIKGGSEKYMFTIADSFKKLGHEVVFFCMEDKKNLECSTSKYFVSNKSKDASLFKKINFVMHIAYSKEAYTKMLLLLKNEEPDLVLLNLVHKQLTCSVIQAIRDYDKKIPIVWTVHDLIHVCPSYTMLDGKGNICERCLDGNFSNCSKNKCCHNSRLMSILSCHEANVIKKHHWYDLVDLYICPSVFYKNILERACFTKSRIIYMANPLGVNIEYKTSEKVEDYVLYFGRLSKEKGISTLVKAIKKTGKHLIVLGTGPIEDKLKELIKNERLENNVELLGFKTGIELDSYIEKAKVIVLPSEWYENGPYSAMEALAKGKPLIVSNLGGLPELVDDGKNGFIFKAGDVDDLSNKINLLYNLDSEQYASFGEYSYQKAKESFNVESYIVRLLSEVQCN